jgi:hypothetical protein
MMLAACAKTAPKPLRHSGEAFTERVQSGDLTFESAGFQQQVHSEDAHLA